MKACKKNVPIDKALNVIKTEWERWFPIPAVDDTSPYMGSKQAIEVIEFFVTKGGYFLADEKMYKQKDGLMMGASLSSVIAAIVINDALLKIKDEIKESTFVVVYAEDILMIGDPMDMGMIMLNFKHNLPQMPFTTENDTKTSESKYAIQYLELFIEREEFIRNKQLRGSTISAIWRKKTNDSGWTLNFVSCHNWQAKRALIREMSSHLSPNKGWHSRYGSISCWPTTIRDGFWRKLHTTA